MAPSINNSMYMRLFLLHSTPNLYLCQEKAHMVQFVQHTGSFGISPTTYPGSNPEPTLQPEPLRPHFAPSSKRIR